VNHPPLPTPTHLQLPSQPACPIPWRIPRPTHIPHTPLPQSLSLPTGGNKENVPFNPPLALSQSSIGLNPTACNLNTPIAKHFPRPPSSTTSSLNVEAPAYIPTKAPPSPLNKTAATSLSYPKKHHPPPLPRQPTLHKFFSYSTKVEVTSAPDLGDTWGHSMDPIDSSSIFRVIMQNPNWFSIWFGILLFLWHWCPIHCWNKAKHQSSFQDKYLSMISLHMAALFGSNIPKWTILREPSSARWNLDCGGGQMVL